MKLIVMEGDGIGPEIANATLMVLERVDLDFDLGISLLTMPIGLRALETDGTTFPDRTHKAACAADGVILGPVSHNDYPPVSAGGVNPSGALRKSLDLYANIRPARTRLALPPPCGKPFDLVIVRENTEGFYCDRSMFLGPGEIMPTPDLALSLRKVTREGSTRIVEMAFVQAMARPRKKVTCVHKSNVLRLSDGLFLECARAVAAQYPQVEYEEQLVDSMAAMLVRDPARFDVIVTTNMFGDILSDQAAELSGSLGLGSSLNVGERHAVAQAQHGSAPDIEGRDIANPTALIGSTAMLLTWLGKMHARPRFIDAALAIERALEAVLSAKVVHTRDLGGDAGTRAFANAVVDYLTPRTGAS